MWRALRNSLFPLVALTAVAAQSAHPTKEDAARREMEQAEKARAAEQSAERNAAARAAAAAAESGRLTEDRIAAATKLRQAEIATADAATRMDGLAAQRRQAEASLSARADAMQPLLPLIERLSMFPAETLLAVPAPAEDTLRGVLVLRGLTAQFGQEAAALRHEQVRLAAATAALNAQARQLAAAEAKQQSEAAALDEKLTAVEVLRRQAQGLAAAAAQRAADEASRAATLRGVLAELEARRRLDQERAAVNRARHKPVEPAAASGAAASIVQPRGHFIVPVVGTVIHAWGDATEGGPANGISYQPPPAARVVAPCTGRSVFAAPFRSYGLLLILDCGGGYHAVLAGFDRLDIRVGQDVAAGEPVGVMPNWQPGTSGNRPALYVELRRDGQPVNPAPWLKARG